MSKNQTRATDRTATFDASTEDRYDLDKPLDRTGLSSAKWESEIARTGDPSLLCFGTAEMDYISASPICAALERVVKAGHFGYPFKRASYYEAISSHFRRHFDWTVKKEWIASGVGIYPSMQPIIEELTSPGDAIIYQPPVHHIFPEVIASAGRVALANPLVKRDGRYEMDFDDLTRKVTDRTRMILLCSPHNPVGRVWSREELTRLNSFCLEHGIIVVADEVYSRLVFKGVEFVPFATISRAASLNTITLTSASKAFNVTGLKHSLVITENPQFQDAYTRGLKRSNLYFGGDIFGQAAVEAAFRDCDDWSDAVTDYIEGNFAYLKSVVERDLSGVTVTVPEATYFAWLDFSSLGLPTDGLKSFFEGEAHVVVTLGEFLGQGGAGHVRFNLATARKTIEEGLDRIVTAYKRRIGA
jgi:cystathionine beta-lyase